MGPRVRLSVPVLRDGGAVVKLVVAIHDVTPAHAEAVMLLYRLCTGRGITPALLVVPNWHGDWPLDAHPRFLNWLRARQDDGAELMLHGHRHDEVGLTRRWSHYVRAAGRTAREAEFLALGAVEASARIERGLELMLTVGLRPIGFVPPAWLGTADGQRAAATAGLWITEDERDVYFLDRCVRVRSPVVRWSARTAWRARVSAAVAWARRVTVSDHPVVRVALHPRDLAHPATAGSVSLTMDALAAHRMASPYALL